MSRKALPGQAGDVVRLLLEIALALPAMAACDQDLHCGGFLINGDAQWHRHHPRLD